MSNFDPNSSPYLRSVNESDGVLVYVASGYSRDVELDPRYPLPGFEVSRREGDAYTAVATLHAGGTDEAFIGSNAGGKVDGADVSYMLYRDEQNRFRAEQMTQAQLRLGAMTVGDSLVIAGSEVYLTDEVTGTNVGIYISSSAIEIQNLSRPKHGYPYLIAVSGSGRSGARVAKG